MFTLGEAHVRDENIKYYHIWVLNVRENIHKDHLRKLEEGPFLVPKIVQDSPPNVWQSTPSGFEDASLVGKQLL